MSFVLSVAYSCVRKHPVKVLKDIQFDTEGKSSALVLFGSLMLTPLFVEHKKWMGICPPPKKIPSLAILPKIILMIDFKMQLYEVFKNVPNFEPK